MVTLSDEFAGSNIASKFIKMVKTGFKIVISQEMECLNPIEVYIVTLLKRKPQKVKIYSILVKNGPIFKFSKLVSQYHLA